jgi:hypothetical protein
LRFWVQTPVPKMEGRKEGKIPMYEYCIAGMA